MDGSVQRVGEDVGPEVVYEYGTAAAERFQVRGPRSGPVSLAEACGVALGEAVGAEEVHRFTPLADQDYPAGYRRAGVDHAPGEVAHKVLGGLVQGEFAGDAGEGRHALFQHTLCLRPLRDVVGHADQGLPAIADDHARADLDVQQRAVLADVPALAHGGVDLLQDAPNVGVHALAIGGY